MSTSAFAYHTSGWGVGVAGRFNLDLDDFGSAFGAALSLKAPQLPIYWGINLAFRQSGFNLNLTGDGYLFDETLAEKISLGWFLGLGAYAGTGIGNNGYASTSFGVRTPVGIYMFPVNSLEIFLNLAPSLGVGFYFGDSPKRFRFPESDIGLDIGVRFWF